MKISIITPTFNSETWVEKTIQSVLNQKFQPIEYIIVDGGSTDRTLSIVERYRDRIARVISEPDQGVADAMNKGIGVATGDVVGIIHSDDIYAHNDVVSRVAAEFDKDPSRKITYGKLWLTNPKSSGDYVAGEPFDLKRFRREMTITHPTVFCRREVYERYGVFRTDYRYAMDYEFLLRFVDQYEPLFIDDILAVHRLGGLSTKNFRHEIRAITEVLRAKRTRAGGLRLSHIRDYVMWIAQTAALRGLEFTPTGRAWIAGRRKRRCGGKVSWE